MEVKMRKPKEILQELDYVNRVIDQYLTYIENCKDPSQIENYQESLELIYECKDVLEWVLNEKI